MRIRKLELKNFRCFEEQKLQFPRGLLGILGPNGSGKSTLLEAIAWAFYGTGAARTCKEEIRYDGAAAGAECSVAMNFEIAGDSYRLVRKMRGKTQTIQAKIEDSNNEVLVESATGVEKYIADHLLNMSRSSFFKSVFSRQKEVDALYNTGAETR